MSDGHQVYWTDKVTGDNGVISEERAIEHFVSCYEMDKTVVTARLHAGEIIETSRFTYQLQQSAAA